MPYTTLAERVLKSSEADERKNKKTKTHYMVIKRGPVEKKDIWYFSSTNGRYNQPKGRSGDEIYTPTFNELFEIANYYGRLNADDFSSILFIPQFSRKDLTNPERIMKADLVEKIEGEELIGIEGEAEFVFDYYESHAGNKPKLVVYDLGEVRVLKNFFYYTKRSYSNLMDHIVILDARKS